MKTLFLLITALVMSGCGVVGTATVPTGTQPVIFLQRGVMLQVINFCPGVAVLYPSHPASSGQVAVPLPQGTPTWVPMAPMPLMATKEVVATIQFTQNGVFSGSVSKAFRIDRHSTQTVQWVVSESNSGGSGRNLITSRCPG